MIQLTNVSSARGAPMGRRSFHAPGIEGLEFELERVPLVDGAYDCAGAYFGSPDDLWVARAEQDGEEVVFYFLRAEDIEAARAEVLSEYPGATFKPQTGSVIQQTIDFLQRYLDGLDDEDRELAAGTEEERDDLQGELDEIKWSNRA